MLFFGFNRKFFLNAKSTFVLAASLFSATSAQSAPHPGAAMIAPKIGIYRSQLGFEIAAGTSGWKMANTPGDSKYIAAIFKSAKSKSAALTVRVDPLEKDISLDQYIQRWLKEYPKFGFDVLGSKPFMQNQKRGYVVDLLNRDNKRQMRQVVFVSAKKRSAVILTCRDQEALFKESLKTCNSIIRTFSWQE
jgi:hypothetical protein